MSFGAGGFSRSRYSAHFGYDSGRKFLTFRGVGSGAYLAWCFEDESNTLSRVCVPFSLIGQDRLLFQKYTKHAKYDLNGVLKFWLFELTFASLFLRIASWVSQAWFNYRVKEASEQLILLEFLVHRRLCRGRADSTPSFLRDADFVGVTQIMHELYGNRIFMHPKLDAWSDRAFLVLEGLAINGKIEARNRQFRASGASVSEIARIKEDNRRHSSAHFLNVMMIVLTAAIAVPPIIELYESHFTAPAPSPHP